MATVMSMGSAFPEMEGRSPLDSKRRIELFKMAVESEVVSADDAMPTKDTLITLLKSGVKAVKRPVEVTQEDNPLAKFDDMKNPQLWGYCKENGIPWHKSDKREVLMERILDHLNGIHAT